MLSTGATERYAQIGKSPLYVFGHTDIYQRVAMVQKMENSTVIFQELYYRPVKASEFLVRIVASGVVQRSAIEHKSAPISRVILRNSLFE